MNWRRMVPIKPSEITPEHVYLSRRTFIAGLGAVLAGACAGAGGLAASGPATPAVTPTPPAPPPPKDELGDPATPYELITAFNNFYEFTFDKRGVALLAKDYPTDPWTVQVGGLVNKPKTYGMEDLLKRFVQEERIYRLRCVETWSMVIPWLGFRLADLLKEVEPTSQARYVRFESVYDPERMPSQKAGDFNWPYVEGLRLDEALHNLTILATGLYGKALLPQNGAPIRLVVPWKYGFKSIKSIVKIDLVADMPTSLWMAAAPHEYGFYATVNPDAPHPRWSQAVERRMGQLGEDTQRKTLVFNGYDKQVAHLYPGDLRKDYY